MTKCKVGDKVRRIVKDYDSQMKIGQQRIVTGVVGTYIPVDNRAIGISLCPYSEKYFELVTEEPKMTQQFKAMKIRIKDTIHSRMVQEVLFEMGYRWGASGQNIVYTDKEVIYAECDGEILHGTLPCFYGYDHEEVELVTTYSLKPVDQEAKRKREEKEALEKNVAEIQKQLDEMKQKLDSMT